MEANTSPAEITVASKIYEMAIRTITALPQSYMNFNAFGRRIIRLNSSELNEKFIKCIVLLHYARQKFNVSYTDSPTDIVEKMEALQLSSKLVSNFTGILNIVCRTRNALYNDLHELINVAVFYLNQNKHYKIHFPFDPPKTGERGWIVLVDYDMKETSDLSSIGILTRETRLIRGLHYDIGDVVLNHDDFIALLNKYKPNGNQNAMGVLAKLSVNYSNVSRESDVSENALYHGIKRAYGRAKKLVRIVREDGASLSKTGTYTREKIDKVDNK